MEALAAGYGPSEIRSHCTTGRWVRLRRGVLVTAEDVTPSEESGHRFRLDCLAVLLSLDRPTAVASHATAARLWELPLPRTADPMIPLTHPVQCRHGRREDELRSLDIRVVRVADADLGTGWAAVGARLRQLVGTAGPAGPRFTAIPRVHRVRRTG